MQEAYIWEKVQAKDKNKIAYILHLKIPVSKIMSRLCVEKTSEVMLSSPFGPLAATSKYMEPSVKGIEEIIMCSRYSLGVIVGRLFSAQEVLKEILHRLEISIDEPMDEFQEIVASEFGMMELDEEVEKE